MSKVLKAKYKYIKILTPGSIAVMGSITGPILKPFKKDIETIRHLVLTGYDVVQVLRDGTEITLDMDNYDENFEAEQKQAKKIEKETVIPDNPVQEKKQDSEPVREAAPRQQKPQQQQRQFNNDRQKNKKNK